MFKKEKGITLIALIVTIIILLILAGVTINLAINDNGIFKRAQNASKRWNEAENAEAYQMNSAAGIMDNIANEYSVN